MQESTNDPFQDQVEKLLALLGAQSRGEICAAEIEETLSAIVPQKQEMILQPDTTNYDETTLDDDNKNNSIDKKAVLEERSQRNKKATMESLRQQEQQNDDNTKQNDKSFKYISHLWKTLDDIPLGRVGAKMMVTFGDGRNPNADVVAAVLMGTRTCLQYAVKDARALRRKQKHEFVKARMATALYRIRKDDKQQPTLAETATTTTTATTTINQDIDPTMVFRAVSGYDSLSYDSKVGFDVSQLDVLFPEEMNAYKRWEKMHHDYEVSSKKADDAKVEDGVNNKKNKNEDEIVTNNSKVDDVDDDDEWGCGGHLRGRMAQFDARTARMKEDWYMTFAEVRQGGSFLNSRFKTREDKQWNEEKKRRLSTKAGPRREATWETLNALSVQFLHWLGFDPSSSLPPPNEEITQALAFLGHDFLGKIVEKAIFLRLQKKITTSDSANSITSPILELGEGEQLEVGDIECALNDTSISSNNSSGQSLQLYFGPGFEDRLEMELEQLLKTQNNNANTNSSRGMHNDGSTQTADFVTEDELQVRKEEDELFSKLTSQIPIKLEGVTDILGVVLDEQLLEQRKKTKKQRAASDATKQRTEKKRKKNIELDK